MVFDLIFLKAGNGAKASVCVRLSKVMFSFGYVTWKVDLTLLHKAKTIRYFDITELIDWQVTHVLHAL